MILMFLKRDTKTTKECVGTLTVGSLRLQTIERPWVPHPNGGKAGAKFISCVPPGLYRVERFRRPSGERALILSAPELGVYGLPENVPTGQEQLVRTLCLIHTANFSYEVNGCIGPGLTRSKTPEWWMVANSREAMNRLRSAVGTDLEIKLRIEE